MIKLTIDDLTVEVPEGTTIWDAAQSAGIEIPILCHEPRMRPVGVCRLCVVDVGGRTLAASCVRSCEPGMEVRTSTPEIESHRKTLTELLVCDQPPADRDPKESTVGGNDLLALARQYDARRDRFPAGNSRPADPSSTVIAVDHQSCILCDRCIRACDDLVNNSHSHASADCMIQEGRMDCLPHCLLAAKRERNVRNSSAHFGIG